MWLRENSELRAAADFNGFERDDSMKKNLMIVTGCPGSGKSCLAERICSRFPELELISYDTVKEDYFDRYGFDSAADKTRLNNRSLKEFYRILDGQMEKEKSILIEYPFCRKHADTLRELAEQHGYSVITVLLTGDMRTLYLRGLRRDDNDKRHPGHLLNRYHRGQPFSEEDWIQAMPFDAYVRMCREKDYNIRLGRTITVDVTDIRRVDIEKICDDIETAL